MKWQRLADSGSRNSRILWRRIAGVHLALETDNMDQDYQQLKEKGVTIISNGPQTIPDTHPIFAGTKVLYVQDPEGHPLELIQMPN